MDPIQSWETLRMLGRGRFLPIPKGIMMACAGDCSAAVLLAYLIDQGDILCGENELPIFYATHESIKEYLNIPINTQKRIVNDLKSWGLLKTFVKGLPAKRYFQLNSQAILEMNRLGKDWKMPAQTELPREPETGYLGGRISAPKEAESRLANITKPEETEPKGNQVKNPKVFFTEGMAKNHSLDNARLAYCSLNGPNPEVYPDHWPDIQFNPLAEFNPRNNFIPFEINVEPRFRTDWWNPGLPSNIGTWLKALPWFQNVDWGDNVPFVWTDPQLYPDPQIPPLLTVSEKDIPKDSPAPKTDSQAPKQGKAARLIAPVLESRVPRTVLAQILAPNKDLFCQMNLKEGSPVSKTELTIGKILNQVKAGTFLISYKWKEGWMDGKIAPDTKLGSDNMDWDGVVELVGQSIKALKLARTQGLQYPKPDSKGKVPRIPLASYLLNQNPNGITAPWLGFLYGYGQKMDYESLIQSERQRMIEPVLKQLDACIRDNFEHFVPGMSAEWKFIFWRDMRELIDWPIANKEKLLAADVTGSNSLWLFRNSKWAEVIVDYFVTTKFIGAPKPGSERWKAFSLWAMNTYGINLDMSRKKLIHPKPTA